MNFTNPREWWTYTKEDIMAHAYWERGQLPPSNHEEYEQAWSKLQAMLTQRYGDGQ